MKRRRRVYPGERNLTDKEVQYLRTSLALKRAKALQGRLEPLSDDEWYLLRHGSQRQDHDHDELREALAAPLTRV